MDIQVAEKNFRLLAKMVERATNEGSAHLFQVAKMQMERLESQYPEYASKVQHEVDMLRQQILDGTDGTYHTLEVTMFNGNEIAVGKQIDAHDTKFTLTGIVVETGVVFLVLRDQSTLSIYKVPKKELEALGNQKQITPLVKKYPHTPPVTKPIIPHIEKVPRRKLEELRRRSQERNSFKNAVPDSIEMLLDQVFTKDNNGAYPDWKFLMSFDPTKEISIQSPRGNTSRSARMDAEHILYPERFGLTVHKRFQPFQKKVASLVEEYHFHPQPGESISQFVSRLIASLQESGITPRKAMVQT